MEKDGISEMIQSAPDDLDHAIQELGKAVPPIPFILLDPAQRTLHTMKQGIRRILQTDIKLYTHLQYSQSTTQLSITIHNKSTVAIPVKVATATLDFKSVSHAATDSQPDLPSAAPLIATDDASLFLSPSSSIVLQPTCQHTEVLKIITSTTQQYNGRIQIQVLPVNYPALESVSITHSFGIYLIDQMKKSIVHPPQQQQEEEGHEWTYQGQFLREMFDMDPVMALEQGMFVCLESSNGTKILCRIDGDDGDSVKVCFFGANKDLVRSLVHELDSLDV